MRNVSVTAAACASATGRRELVVDEVVGHEQRREPERLGLARQLGELLARARVVRDQSEAEPAIVAHGPAMYASARVSGRRSSPNRRGRGRSRRACRPRATRRPRPAGSRAARCGRRGWTSNGSDGSVFTSSTADLVAVPGVDEAGRVEARDAVPQREPGARLHEAGVARAGSRSRCRSGPSARPPPGASTHAFAREEVEPGVAVVLRGRQRELGIEAANGICTRTARYAVGAEVAEQLGALRRRRARRPRRYAGWSTTMRTGPCANASTCASA